MNQGRRVLSLESAKKTERKWGALTQPKANGVLRSRLPVRAEARSEKPQRQMDRC